MKNKNITVQRVGFVLTLILTIGVLGIPMALATSPPPYTQLTDATAEENNGKMKLSVTAAAGEGGEIPRFPDSYINSVIGFGYAWLTGPNTAVVAAIHPDFDDSAQNPNAWHTHTVTLDGDGCITDLGPPQGGGIKIDGNTMTLQISKQFAGDVLPGNAISFELVPNSCEIAAALKLSGPEPTS